MERDVGYLHHRLAAALDRLLIHAVTVVDVQVDRGGIGPTLRIRMAGKFLVEWLNRS